MLHCTHQPTHDAQRILLDHHHYYTDSLIKPTRCPDAHRILLSNCCSTSLHLYFPFPAAMAAHDFPAGCLTAAVLAASTGVGPAVGEGRGGSLGETSGELLDDVAGEAVVDETAELVAAAAELLLVLDDVDGFRDCLGDLMTVSSLRAAAASAGVGSAKAALGEMVRGERGLSAGLTDGEGGLTAGFTADLGCPLLLLLPLLALLLLLLV